MKSSALLIFKNQLIEASRILNSEDTSPDDLFLALNSFHNALFVQNEFKVLDEFLEDATQYYLTSSSSDALSRQFFKNLNKVGEMIKSFKKFEDTWYAQEKENYRKYRGMYQIYLEEDLEEVFSKDIFPKFREYIEAVKETLKPMQNFIIAHSYFRIISGEKNRGKEDGGIFSLSFPKSN